jgi:hypothetical protein
MSWSAATGAGERAGRRVRSARAACAARSSSCGPEPRPCWSGSGWPRGPTCRLEPRLLLLDEPGAGLNRDEKRRLGALIRAIRDGGTTVLLVDHHMDLVMDISDEVLVLASGEKLAEGPPSEVRCHPAVVAAYLGEAL